MTKKSLKQVGDFFERLDMVDQISGSAKMVGTTS